MRVLMVCLGNICRSPLAEGILNEMCVQKNLYWTIDSAGTGGHHVGQAPDSRSRKVAQIHGIDIRNQRARKICKDDIDDFELILAMDQDNLEDLQQFFRNRTKHDKQIDLISNYSEKYKGMGIPDPYYDDNGFENVYQMLEDCIEGVLKAYH